MTKDEAISEVNILLSACQSAVQDKDTAIVNIDKKAQEALQFLLREVEND